MLPWALLVAGSIASLAANVAVADRTVIGRVIAAWPSFALTASFELLARQVRRGAGRGDSQNGEQASQRQPRLPKETHAPGLQLVSQPQPGQARLRAGSQLQRQAWQWALANRDADGALPSGEAIARAHGRKERWGRLVKSTGLAGNWDTEGARGPPTSETTDERRHDGAAATVS